MGSGAGEGGWGRTSVMGSGTWWWLEGVGGDLWYGKWCMVVVGGGGGPLLREVARVRGGWGRTSVMGSGAGWRGGGGGPGTLLGLCNVGRNE